MFWWLGGFYYLCVMSVIEKTTVTRWGQTKEIKKIKDENFVDWSTLKTGELAKSETNDCVVLSFMIASGNSYDDTHSFVGKRLKRKFRKGTYTCLYLKYILGERLGSRTINYVGHSKEAVPVGVDREKVIQNGKSRYTVKSFMEKYNKGRYVVIVKGHAYALVDGVMYGNKGEQFNGFRRIVRYAFELK